MEYSLRTPRYAPSAPGRPCAQPPPVLGPHGRNGAFRADAGQGSAMARDTVKHENDLTSAASRLFLSSGNAEALHEAIRYRVYVESGGRHTIGRQSDTELAVVMRSVLLQHGDNDDSRDPVVQVRELNARVLKYCVDNVLSQVEGYVSYVRDASRMPTPMPRGAASSIKGTGERSLQYGAAHFI